MATNALDKTHRKPRRIGPRPEPLTLWWAVWLPQAPPERARRVERRTTRVFGRERGEGLLVLPDPSVSRRHFELTWNGGDSVRLRDLGSSNGTWARGTPVPRGEGIEMPLPVFVRAGDAVIAFERGPAKDLPAEATPLPLLGLSPHTRRLYAQIDEVAPTDLPVLIVGPTGAGKELVARSLHERHPTRRKRPVVPINCGAIPEHLAESELFGHERGAFTGADRAHRGAFERANGGTLFLDEVGELPESVQAKLLRVLETHEFVRVGGERPIAVDVRVLAATLRDIDDEARFRADLRYRLEGARIVIEPLANRPLDLLVLAAAFVQRLATGKMWPLAPRPWLTPDALERLLLHDWPGNVRELRNVVERAWTKAQRSGRPVIDIEDLPLGAPRQPRSAHRPNWPPSPEELFEEIELRGHTHQQVADRYGVYRETVSRRIRRYKDEGTWPKGD